MTVKDYLERMADRLLTRSRESADAAKRVRVEVKYSMDLVERHEKKALSLRIVGHVLREMVNSRGGPQVYEPIDDPEE